MAVRQLIAGFYYRMAQQDGKEPHRTVGYLEKCIAFDDKNSLFHFSLGRAYLRKGLAKPSKARERYKWVRNSIDEFHKAIELEPSKSDYHFHLGISYGSLPYPPPFYWEVILNSFKRTAILNPTKVDHLYSMGTYYLNENQRLKNINQKTGETSLSNYDKYVAISKDNYQFFFMKILDVNGEYLCKILEKCFLVTQQYADLKAIIRDTPNDHAFLARFLNKKGMWKEAKEEYKEAINLEPTNPIHYSNFAHALFRRGDFEHAIHWWRKQKFLNPGDEKAYLSLAYVFMKLKRFNEALQELYDLVDLSPENINYRVKLIRTLMAVHRLDEAMDEYHKIIEKDQNLSKQTYETIRHYRRQGNHRKAIKILNEALSSALNK